MPNPTPAPQACAFSMDCLTSDCAVIAALSNTNLKNVKIDADEASCLHMLNWATDWATNAGASGKNLWVEVSPTFSPAAGKETAQPWPIGTMPCRVWPVASVLSQHPAQLESWLNLHLSAEIAQGLTGTRPRNSCRARVSLSPI
jgi:hypothetical protein